MDELCVDSDSEAMRECKVPQRSHLGNSMDKSEAALGQALIHLKMKPNEVYPLLGNFLK